MGFEILTQPQVFLSPITAVGGIQNGLFGDALPPLYTSFYTWTSTASVTAQTFPLTGIETLTDRSGSYIVTVGGVVQSPTSYTVDVINRLLTFDFDVNADTPIVVTQIGTIATSALNITNLTATDSIFNNITATDSVLQNVNADSMLVTSLTALTAEFRVIDITQFELSGFTVQGDATIVGNTSVAGTLTATDATITSLTATSIESISDTPFNAAIVATSDTSTTNWARLDLNNKNLTQPATLLLNSLSAFGIANRNPQGTIIFYLSTDEVFRVNFNKKIGIGTTAPNELLTVAGNVSASGAIKAVNIWPNRQYRILSADEVPFAANTGTVLWSAAPLTVQPNSIYTTTFTTFISSTGSTPIYTFTLSGNAPFTILEGTATGSVTNESGNPYFARDLRELNTGTPTNTYVVIPARTYTSVGPHSFSISPIISAATTTQIVLSCFSNTISRVKSSSSYFGSLLQTV